MYKRIYSNNFRKNLKSYLKNHKLQGQYKNLYECHIQSDVLLVYEKNEKLGLIILINIGSHSNLFG